MNPLIEAEEDFIIAYERHRLMGEGAIGNDALRVFIDRSFTSPASKFRSYQFPVLDKSKLICLIV